MSIAIFNQLDRHPPMQSPNSGHVNVLTYLPNPATILITPKAIIQIDEGSATFFILEHNIGLSLLYLG